MSKQTKTIIRLSDTDTHSFNDENFIQQRAKVKFKKLITEFINNCDDPKIKNIKPPSICTDSKSQQICIDNLSRVHNTILINGKRGMGKTSFILSIICPENPKQEVWLKDVCNLGIIDPTLIETKEHIFLNIIALIKEAVDEYRKNGYDVSEQCYQGWKCALMKLSGGLSVLDGVGSDHLKDDLWDSAELIFERGLTSSKQGSKLESHFHEFLNVSLQLLGKKVFLLVLDDIDTSLSEGKAILETLRKYLTSKLLIIVMLGDIDLYATIVRQLQWEKMDPNETLYKYESDCKEGEKCKEIKRFYRSQIEHLEEQYLTKLLKPENRITLSTILELNKEIWVEAEGREIGTLSQFVSDLVAAAFIVPHQSQYSKLYEQTLLVQPTRSVVQVLKGWDSARNMNSREVQYNACVDVLRQVFFTTLKKKLEPFDLLYLTQERHLLNRLALYMLKNEISRDSHLKLLPEYRDNDENIAMLFLNAMINAQLETKHYLSYLIKVGYVVERFTVLADAKQLRKFIDHTGLDSDISNAHIARRLLSTFKIDSNTHRTNPVFYGNLSLSVDCMKRINNGDNLALFMSRVYDPKGGHYTFLSLFNLLGVLADISSLADERNFNKNERQFYTERKKNLQDCNLIRDFHSYYRDSGDTSGDDGSDVQNDMSSFNVTDDMVRDMIIWSNAASDITQLLSAAD